MDQTKQVNPFNEDSDLDLVEKSFRFKIGGQPYIIVEANGETATLYQSKILSGVTMTEGKIEGMSGVALGQLYLVSQCLKKLDADGVPCAVSIETVKAWPNRIVKPIYEKIRELSDLVETAAVKDKTKNA